MPSTNFRIAHLHYAEIKQLNWLKLFTWLVVSVTRKKSPNVYKSCPKMILLEKFKILTPSQKLPKNVGDLGNLIAAKGFIILPKVQ